MSRWVRINTDTLEHPLFQNDQRSRHDAWTWLIQNAAWKDTKFNVRGTLHPVPKGSLFTTIRILMDKWKWGNTKTVNFLAELERQDMIIQDSKTGKTLITICNYSHYQTSQDSDKTAARQPQDSDKTQKEPIKPNNNTTLLGGREAEFYAALGDHYQFAASYPSLLVLSEPINWISNGCDIDLDILPTVKALSSRATRITTWAYFSKAVYEAKAKRTAPAPDVTAPIQRPANTRASRESAVFEKFRNMANENKPHLKLIEGSNG